MFLKFTSTLSQATPHSLLDDAVAGLVVTIMLVPQSIAYAFLAGLPPEAGLFASLLPLLVYAMLGSSPTLAVGPVAIISLMTLSVLQGVVSPDNEDYAQYAVLLAGMTGVWLLLFFLIGLGSWTSFISHSVVSGFTSAAAIVIILSQLKYFTGLDIPRGGPGWSPIGYIAEHWRSIAYWPLTVACIGSALLIFWQRCAPVFSTRMPIPTVVTVLINRAGPLILIVSGALLVILFDPPLATVGAVPSGLPTLALPDIANLDWRSLLLPSAILALIIFLESLSIANSMARNQDVRIKPNQELLALGTANIVASISQAMPVAGGFGRSMVMKSAGARSQWAAILTFGFMSLVCIAAGSWFEHLPHAALGAMIVVATWPLFNWRDGWNAWRFQPSDGLVWVITFIGVLLIDAETGIMAGVLLSLIFYLRRTSQPHIAEIGRIHNTELYRNKRRHEVETIPSISLIRVDENLYFANSDFLINYVLKRVAKRPDIKHVVLVGTAINHVDFCGLEALELIHQRLAERGVTLHLAEFKGTVIDKLKTTHIKEKLAPGRIFFTVADAVRYLTQEPDDNPQSISATQNS